MSDFVVNTLVSRPRRSVLYMPGSNVRAIEKGRSLPNDAVILDLEDAVAPESKAEARENVVAALAEGGFGHREVVVRVNGLDTPWGEADCKALAGQQVDAVLLPKISSASGLDDYADMLADHPFWAMIETAEAMFRLPEIAAHPRLQVLVAGTNDLAAELAMRPSPDRLPFLGFLANMVAAGRANRLAVIDGVFNAIDEEDQFRDECMQGVRFGFDGKTLIHPKQIDPCNAAFSPSAEELSWARKVENAFASPEADGKGAIKVDGKMVELLHLKAARRIMAKADPLIAAG